MKSCEEWQAQIEPYLDGALTRDEEQRFLTHISSCLECSEALEFAKAVRASLAQLPGIDVPDDFCEKLHERIGSEKIKRRTFGTYAKRYGALAACVVLAVVVKTGVSEYDFTKSGESDELAAQYTAATSQPTFEPTADITSVQEQKTGGSSDNTPTNDKIINNEQKRTEVTAMPTVKPVQTAAPVQTPVPVVTEVPQTAEPVAGVNDMSAPEENLPEVAAVSMFTVTDEAQSTAEADNNEEFVKRSSGGGGGGGGSSSSAAKMPTLTVKVTVSTEWFEEVKTTAQKYAVYSGGAYTADKAAYDAFLQELTAQDIEYNCSQEPQGDTVSFVISE